MAGPYVVVGGGVTGLAAAWQLVTSGHEVVVVEAAERWGGKVRTERVDGLVLEHGPDSFVAYRPGAVRLADEVGVAAEVVGAVPPRLVHLRVRGRMRPMPAGMGLVLPTRLGPFATTRILSPWQKLRATADLVLPRRLGDRDVSIGELLRRRLGRGVVARFADPLVGGIYGAGVDELSVDAVLPVLRSHEAEHRSLVLASLAQGRAARKAARAGARHARTGHTTGPVGSAHSNGAGGSRPHGAGGGGNGGGTVGSGGPGGSPFRTMRGGIGQLVEATVAGLADRGADLRLGTRVGRLEERPDGVRVTLADGTAIDAAGVVLAGGAQSSAMLLADLAPEASRALGEIRHGSTNAVHLAFDADAFDTPPAGHGYLEAGPDRPPVSAVTIISAKWADRAPTGTVLVRAFVPGRVGPASTLPDADLLDAVTSHVSATLGARRAPVLRHLVRWPSAMPTYTVGHLDRVAAVEAALAAGRVRVAGSALHGVGLPDCIADGRRVAAELAGAAGAAQSGEAPVSAPVGPRGAPGS